MTINYPNGKKFHHYHFNKDQEKKTTHYDNRGMNLEKDLSLSNDYYRHRNIAVIHKKPTPIQVVNVDYPKRSAAVINKAYYRKPSTTDYNGIYRGYYIDFEAKESKQKSRFPLSNFKSHQIEHLRACTELGGICFAILSFTSLDRLFILDADDLCYYWDYRDKLTHGKSISLTDIEEKGIEITYGFQPRIPYLDAVDQLIEKKRSQQS